MLLCLGRAPNQAQNKTGLARRHTGLHHACIVTPHGDYCIEPASTAAFRQPAAYEELTPAAHTTILHLLQSPPVEPATPPPPTAASDPRPASPRPSTEADARGLPPTPHHQSRFPTFPLTLPPDVYRAPPLSAVIAATPSSDIVLPARGKQPGAPASALVSDPHSSPSQRQAD